MLAETSLAELEAGIVRVTLPMPARPGHVHAYLVPGSDGWTIVATGLGLVAPVAPPVVVAVGDATGLLVVVALGEAAGLLVLVPAPGVADAVVPVMGCACGQAASSRAAAARVRPRPIEVVFVMGSPFAVAS